MTDAGSAILPARGRIVDVASRLLLERGPSAVTTRGVAEAAGVQAPAIYRLFGDKEGLLEAVADHIMRQFVAHKAAAVENARADDVDPLHDLRAGWDAQIAFGLDNPSVFRLLSDPDRARRSAVARAGREVLAARVRRVAAIGRLRVSERRAVEMIQAGVTGTIQTLLALEDQERDHKLADAMYDAVLAQILTETAPTRRPTELSAIVGFRAVAPSIDALSHAERQLVIEWLDRAIAAGE